MSLDTELLIAIHKSDFTSSSKILEKFLAERRLDELASSLQSTIIESTDLRIRDHISHFLSIDPVYCAIEVPSFDLLHIVKEAGTRYGAAQQMFDYVGDLIDSRKPALNTNTIRIERAAASAYSVFLPGILQRRVQEIENCKVPYAGPSSHGSGRSKYYIGDLLTTAYGKSIIRSILGSYVQPIIGDEMWNQIAIALRDLGFAPDSMFEEIPFDEWYDHMKSLNAKHAGEIPILHGIPPIDEIDAIRRLVIAIHGVEEIKWRSDIYNFHLETIKNLRTNHYNKELIELLPHLANKPQEIVVKILVNTRDLAAEEILNGFLTSEDSGQRAIAARGLARLNALESPIAASDPRSTDSIDVSELLASTKNAKARRLRISSDLVLLAMSPSPRVKKDLVKILVELYDSDTKEIFFQLLSDPNEEVGLELLAQIEKLPQQLAREILRAALESLHSQVVIDAERRVAELHLELS